MIATPTQEMYLLDANVVSELRKEDRSPKVVRWIESIHADGLFLSVFTIGEIAKGIALQRRLGTEEAMSRADALQNWLEGMLAIHGRRILPIDVEVATRWGRLCSTFPHLAVDMLLAATALQHGLTVATRNVQHFEATGVDVVNPFE